MVVIADKGQATVLMDRQEFNDKIGIILNDSNSYTLL